MSAFIDHLEANETRQYKPKTSPIKYDMRQLPQEFAMDCPLLRGYEITASYHQRFFCDPQDLDKMIKNAKRVVKEHIYGKFRLLVLDMERAVYEGDEMKIRDICTDILGEVFNA